MILTGEFEADQTVTQDELAELLGVSTMPVREAVLRLSHEGLMTVHPGRSVQVTAPTRDDIADIYWLHGILAGELDCAGRPTWRSGSGEGTPTDDRGRRGRRGAVGSGGAQLGFTVGSIRPLSPASCGCHIEQHCALFQRFFSRTSWTGLKLSTTEHLAIVAKIAEGDSEGARELAQVHSWEAGKVLVANLETLSYLEGPRADAQAHVGLLIAVRRRNLSVS